MVELYTFFSKYGYTEEQINTILSIKTLSELLPKTLLQKAKDVIGLLEGFKYDKSTIITITTASPLVFSNNINYLEKKITFYEKLGFTRDNLKIMIRRAISVLIVSEDKINDKIGKLLELGYSDENVKTLIINNPKILLKRIKSSDEYDDDNPLSNQDNSVETKLKNIMSLGYTKEQALKITIDAPVLLNYEINTIKQKIKNIMDIDFEKKYSEKEVLKMVLTYPTLICYDISYIKKKINDFIKLGYTQKMVRKIIKNNPFVVGLNVFVESDEDNNVKSDDNDIENKLERTCLKDKVCKIINLGYTKEQVLYITSTQPTILNLAFDTILYRVLDTMRLGYSYNSVLDMFRRYPTLFALDIDNMKRKITDIVKLDYTYEQVLLMCFNMPEIFGLSIENLSEKIEFYDTIGLHDLVINKTKNLIQSVDLTYARYHFLSSINIGIDENSNRCLFLCEHDFKKRFGITNAEVINMFSYDNVVRRTRT